jgi:hypothetical protein
MFICGSLLSLEILLAGMQPVQPDYNHFNTKYVCGSMGSFIQCPYIWNILKTS